MSFDTPWYGFSGDGERTFGFCAGGSSCPDTFRSILGDGGGCMSAAIIPTVAFTDARDGCCSRATSSGSGERRAGRPLIDAPVGWAFEPAPALAAPNGVSNRPTGDERRGRPVGDVRNLERSRSRAESSGTARFALGSTGELEGESFGKRVAAAEGDAAA